MKDLIKLIVMFTILTISYALSKYYISGYVAGALTAMAQYLIDELWEDKDENNWNRWRRNKIR